MAIGKSPRPCFPLHQRIWSSFIMRFISQDVSINPEIWYLPDYNQRRVRMYCESAQASRFTYVYILSATKRSPGFRAGITPRGNFQPCRSVTAGRAWDDMINATLVNIKARVQTFRTLCTLIALLAVPSVNGILFIPNHSTFTDFVNCNNLINSFKIMIREELVPCYWYNRLYKFTVEWLKSAVAQWTSWLLR